MKRVTLNKCLKGVVPSVALIFFFIMVNLTFAETIVFIEEYTYQASEADSKISSRAIALEQVKRVLLEKLGTYLESETEVKNFQLTKDKIVTLTAGIVSAEIIDEKWDGKTYYLKAKISADSKEVIKSIDRLRKDRQKVIEAEETRKNADRLLKEIERLKFDFTGLERIDTKTPGKQKEFILATKRLSAIYYKQKGDALLFSGKNMDATRAFDEAINLNPQYAMAYMGRGMAYMPLNDFYSAIKDFDKALDLNPKDVEAYRIRGYVYRLLGNSKQAIRDFNKAISIDPQNPLTYISLADYYAEREDYKNALKFYNRAIDVEPSNYFGYSGRGNLHKKNGDYSNAIKDLDKAILLNPNYPYAYFDRGFSYYKLRDYRQAISDLDKAIELQSNNSLYYMIRGYAYVELNDGSKAAENFKAAARLGDKIAQDILMHQGIKW